MNDLLLGTNSDLLIENGDLVTGFSDGQQEELLLTCDKGDWKQYPDRCVGIGRYLKDEGEGHGLEAEIKKEYERDGMTVKSINLTPDGKLVTHAHY